MNKLNLDTEFESGVITFRPKHFLNEIEKISDTRLSFSLHFPSSEIGSLTTLEATMLMSLLYLSGPKVIFEFGTFLGYSTALFLNNSNSDCKVFSLDLPRDGSILNTEYSENVLRSDIDNDNYLSSLQSQLGEVYLNGMSSDNLNRLTLIKQDSMNFNPKNEGLSGCVDFIFIDGGHTTELITRDTYSAMEMASNGAIVVWHDYNSNIHRDVTDYVHKFSQNRRVYHIANTMLAFTIV